MSDEMSSLCFVRRMKRGDKVENARDQVNLRMVDQKTICN